MSRWAALLALAALVGCAPDNGTAVLLTIDGTMLDSSQRAAIAARRSRAGGAPLGAADFALIEEVTARAAQAAAARAASRKTKAATEKPHAKPAPLRKATKKSARKK